MDKMHSSQPGSSYGASASSRAPSRTDDLEFPHCPDSNKYEKLTKIGQGTFGLVMTICDIGFRGFVCICIA